MTCGLLKKCGTCFDKLSMNGISSIIYSSSPFVLSLSKDSERVFQQTARMKSHRLIVAFVLLSCLTSSASAAAAKKN